MKNSHNNYLSDKNGSGVRFGFGTEPIINLNDIEGEALYSECLTHLMISQNALLANSNFVQKPDTAEGIGLLDAAIVELVLDTLDAQPNAILGCNISPHTLADSVSWMRITHGIERHHMSATRLTLEITESVPIDEITKATDRLKDAKTLGCRLAIDDFGAGYAQEWNLRRINLDWDIIKIDRSCFGGLSADRLGLDARIGGWGLQALIEMAAGFAPIVVTDGIETTDHLVAARAAGATYGQGWLFDRTAACELWTLPPARLGARLARALIEHGAIVRPWESNDQANGADAYQMKRIDGPGEVARAVVRAHQGEH